MKPEPGAKTAFGPKTGWVIVGADILVMPRLAQVASQYVFPGPRHAGQGPRGGSEAPGRGGEGRRGRCAGQALPGPRPPTRADSAGGGWRLTVRLGGGRGSPLAARLLAKSRDGGADGGEEVPFLNLVG